MSNDYPDIQRGTRWEHTQARQWQNLARDVQGPANIQAGAGILVTRTGQHFNIRVSDALLQLLTRRQPQAPAVAAGIPEKFRVVVGPSPYGMRADYFTVVKLGVERDPETNLYRPEDLVKIAKPWELRRSTSDGRTRYLEEFRVTVRYEFRSATNHVRRTATQTDVPHISQLQMIWNEYAANEFINAQHLGEEGTDVDGVEWEDLNETGRVWSVLPVGFLTQ